jgi:hypothetical protein
MWTRVAVVTFVCTVVSIVSVVRGQQPAKPINVAPLEHPDPLTSIRSADTARVMGQVRDAAAASGFSITRTDNSRLSLEARRAEPTPSRDYDRVLIWLERSPSEPAASLDLYLAYGRYEAILARNGIEVFRVVVPAAFEDQRLSALRPRLLALGN